jgi:hypothetical protein
MWFILACTEYDVTGNTKTPGAAPPVIEVSPLSVDFGALAPGKSETAKVTVGNVGGSLLTLGDPELADAGGVFSMEALGATALEPGDSTWIKLGFSPTDSSSSSGTLRIFSDDPENPTVDVLLTGGGLPPSITLTPQQHDFGTLEPGTSATVAVTISSSGSSDLHISEVRYEAGSAELQLTDDATGSCGALPWTLPSGSSCVATVTYTPADASPDEGRLYVVSDDPTQPEAVATQIGNGKPFAGFSTGWYIVDDPGMYETTSNGSYVVETHGDLDGYWYEPSGAHGMIGSTDIPNDFATLRNYILARAGAPTAVSGPLNFDTSSVVPSLTYASYSWILCDFWLDATDDPARYSISSGSVDDGLLVIVNGEILGNLYLGQTGNWPLSNAVPGQVNSLVLILMDNAQVNKYAHDLAFYRDGVMVQ